MDNYFILAIIASIIVATIGTLLNSQSKEYRNIRIYGIIVLMIVVVIIWFSLPKPSTVPVIKSKYSFETGLMDWVAQDYEDSQACVGVFYSNDYAKEGQYALKMVIDLIPGDEHKDKGEAYVNMLSHTPAGENVPLDLTNRKVTAWVYAPKGAKGDKSKPNGFQLFVKDKNSKSEYGSWNDVAEALWTQVSLTISTSKPPEGWMDDGFEPSQIVKVGVKMGAGGGSTEKFKGNVYVDAVDW